MPVQAIGVLCLLGNKRRLLLVVVVVVLHRMHLHLRQALLHQRLSLARCRRVALVLLALLRVVLLLLILRCRGLLVRVRATATGAIQDWRREVRHLREAGQVILTMILVLLQSRRGSRRRSRRERLVLIARLRLRIREDGRGIVETAAPVAVPQGRTPARERGKRSLAVRAAFRLAEVPWFRIFQSSIEGRLRLRIHCRCRCIVHVLVRVLREMVRLLCARKVVRRERRPMPTCSAPVSCVRGRRADGRSRPRQVLRVCIPVLLARRALRRQAAIEARRGPSGSSDRGCAMAGGEAAVAAVRI